MTPVSMGSLPTPTAHVLPSPTKSGLSAATSTVANTTGDSPYHRSNPQFAAAQKFRPEHAVVFVFDATYLTREMFFKVTAKGGSLEGIMRRLVENGKQALRARKHLEGTVNAAKTGSNSVTADGANGQDKGKEKAEDDEGFDVSVPWESYLTRSHLTLLESASGLYYRHLLSLFVISFVLDQQNTLPTILSTLQGLYHRPSPSSGLLQDGS